MSPGLSKGLGQSGDPGMKKRKTIETEIVKTPSTELEVSDE